MMLRHMLDQHEQEDFSSVKWGMEILEYKRSAFERQIKEAVLIQREAQKHHILNSKSEWNQSSLPKLSARTGDQNLVQMEADLKREKAKENEYEKKIRTLRKERNRARLIKDHNIQPVKRQKISNEEYISVRKTWGQPPPSAPGKTKRKVTEIDEHEEPNNNKIRKEKVEVEEDVETDKLSEENVEIFNVDWDEEIEKHRQDIEKEVLERNDNIELEKEKEDIWKLFEECKSFLEKNERNWEIRKNEREIEKKKLERLQLANTKKENLKNKIEKRKLEEDIEMEKKKLPINVRKEIERKESREKRLEIQETKKSLWQLRHKSKKYEVKSKRVEKLDEIEDLKEKLKEIKNVVEKIRDEEKQVENQRKERVEKIEKEKEKKKAEKLRKEAQRKEKLEKAKLLGKRWEMLRWLTRFLKENQKSWEIEKNGKLKLIENLI